jgi:hypothetical protein
MKNLVLILAGTLLSANVFAATPEKWKCPIPDKEISFNIEKAPVKDILKQIFDTAGVKYTLGKSSVFEQTMLLKTTTTTCTSLQFVVSDAHLKLSGKDPLKIESTIK